MNTKDRAQLIALAERWEAEKDFWQGKNEEPLLPGMNRDELLGEKRVWAMFARIYADHARAVRGLAGD